MFGKHEFYGSTTVGERGQIVLPVKIREEFGIEAGDKLLVLGVGPEKKGAVLIMKAEMLDVLMERMNEHFQSLKDIANGDE